MNVGLKQNSNNIYQFYDKDTNNIIEHLVGTYILTDFNSNEWINASSIQNCLEKIQKRCKENRFYGELFLTKFDRPSIVSLSHVSHLIKSIEVKDNAVYGMIEYLPIDNGLTAYKMLHECEICIFYPRLILERKNNEDILNDIIAWDIIPNNETILNDLNKKLK